MWTVDTNRTPLPMRRNAAVSHAPAEFSVGLGGCYVEAIVPEDLDPFGGRAISSAAPLWATLVPNLGATAFGVFKGIRTGWTAAGV